MCPMNNIYVGEHSRSLDEKLRIVLPTKWRFDDELNGIYMALPNPSGCITIYPPKMVEKLTEKVSEISLGDKQGQKTLAKLFSKADQLSCDKSGRIMINASLCSHSSLSKEVLMVGSFMTFSIWNPEKYSIYINSDNESADEMSEILTQLGL